jgi:hypothetical protein
MWDDVGREVKGESGDDDTRDHIWAEEPAERDARGENGDDFGVSRHFGSEENDGDKHEQRTEKIGEIGHEVGVIVKDDGPCRRMVLRELGKVLIEVEDYGNGNDEQNGEKIRTDKLPDDIPVDAFDIPQGVEVSQEEEFSHKPFHHFLKSLGMPADPL